MKVVETKELTKIYDGQYAVRAVSEVSITFNEGEFIAIAGPSGSGKTTLLNLIGALDQPTSGKIFLDGTDLTSRTKSELADIRLQEIGFIFQSYNLIPVLTAIENVEFVMNLQGVDVKTRRRKTVEILADVGLSEFINRRPGELSGGQQQRVAVARAIVSQPRIVLADEPTANLDSKTGASLLDIMEKMNKDKGITFIFSTHDKMVMDRARRLVLLRDGQVEDDVIR